MAFLTVYVGERAFFERGEVALWLNAEAWAEEPETVKEAGNRKGLRTFTGDLPAAVVDMREAILAAAEIGDIGELKHAIELNELKPDFGAEAKDDPLAYWKRISSDGEGREVLAALATILSMPPAKVALGKNPENTAAFVWPYLAELPLDTLKPGELVDAYRLVSPAELKEMRVKNRWSEWRLVISADGTWISFKR